jgi:predicted nucleic acid-binding protein
MVLVDSSVWISFFSKGESDDLETLIKEDLVLVNDLIAAELIPFMRRAKAKKAINAFEAIKKTELSIFWPGIIELQTLNLKKGVNNVGIPDLIILQNAIQNHCFLWSYDKHFNLMANHTELKLYNTK